MPEKRKKVTEPPAWLMDREDWPEGSREWKARHAWLLRLADVGVVEIGRQLGLSKSTASGLLTDPTGEAARARKMKRYGLCLDCGTKTFNSGSVKLTKRCQPCRIEMERAKGAETKERVAEQVREWTRLHGAPPRIRDWSLAHARLVKNPVERAAALEAARRNIAAGWPAPSTVLFHWAEAGNQGGRWNEALEAIGVGMRERVTASKGIDRQEVWRLYVDERLPMLHVAKRLGCSAGTVEYHLLRLGAPIRRQRRVDHAAIVRLYASGLTTYEVAKRLRCSQGLVSAVVKRAGVSRSPGRRAAA